MEELIAALPPAMRSHYSLVFASRSLQDASFAAPRAILFGEDASLVVSYNGDPRQRGYDALESMEFDAASNSFRFREILFTPDAAGASISAANPARCTACHGDPARPIWDTPPVWPGVYGERYHAGLSAVEAAGMAGFLRLQPTHPRYRWLLGADALAQRDTYVPDSRAVYENSSVEPPNAHLSMLLSSLNVRSILGEMATRSGFEAHRYVLLAAAGGGCGAVEAFYPDRLRTALGAARREFDRDRTAAEARQAAGKAARRSSDGAVYGGGAAPNGLDDLRFVVRNDLALDTRHWTLAFERGSYDLSAPAGALTLEMALRQWVVQKDPKVQELSVYRAFDGRDRYCEYLRQASRHELDAWYGSHAAAVVPAATPDEAAASLAPPLVARCAACHTGEVGPEIPFEDRTALTQRLRSGGYRRGRLLDEILYRLDPQSGADVMPRGIATSPEERRGLEQYFLQTAVGETPSRP